MRIHHLLATLFIASVAAACGGTEYDDELGAVASPAYSIGVQDQSGWTPTGKSCRPQLEPSNCGTEYRYSTSFGTGTKCVYGADKETTLYTISDCSGAPTGPAIR